ncbi:MAG: ferrous iron transport protein B [Sandaracinaceae bacterium]
MGRRESSAGSTPGGPGPTTDGPTLGRASGVSTTVVALAGNPNSGKTTLFNALTGSRARTGNYPGITVDRRSGRLRLPSGRRVELVDVPGTYSLSARSPEEQVAVDAVLPLRGPAPDAVIVVADATTLARHLYLALQVIGTGVPSILVLNMADEADDAGIEIDSDGLASDLGVEVILASASKGRGLDELRDSVDRVLESGGSPAEPEAVASELTADVARVEASLADHGTDLAGPGRRARALWAILSLGDDELEGVADRVRRTVLAVRKDAQAAGRHIDREIIGARYQRIDGLLDRHLRTPGGRDVRRPWTDRLDSVLTHPIAGFVVFAVVMYLLFEGLFTWSEPLIAVIEVAVGGLEDLVVEVFPAGPLQDLLVDGVIAGVGNVLVFIPQIAMLFVFISLLEDSGYLARVAFVIDRLMRSVGLHGKAFVPLLSGFACAVPAVMATRTIENRRDRFVTMLALPFMSCSARLPVYALVIAVVFSARPRLLGVFHVGAVVLFAMYALSVMATLASAAVLRRTLFRGPRPTLVLELPPYRLPAARNTLVHVREKISSFLKDAGTVILAVTVVLWALLSYPVSAQIADRFAHERTVAAQSLRGAALANHLEDLDQQEDRLQLAHSAAGRLGRAIEPAIEPLGFDWRIGIGLIGSFAAREVLVSTLGIVWGVGGDSADDQSLREQLAMAERPDGSLLFTPLSGCSLMVFFVLAAQCMSTLAVIGKETASWRWPLFVLVYMSTVAYVASLLTFQGGRLLGFS